jgi:hypothetical protein
MSLNLPKTYAKLRGVKSVRKGCAKGANRVREGCEPPLFFDEDFRNGEAVRGSVFFIVSCCDPRCRYVHMLAWVRDGHALSFFRGVDAPVSYARTEGN